MGEPAVRAGSPMPASTPFWRGLPRDHLAALRATPRTQARRREGRPPLGRAGHEDPRSAWRRHCGRRHRSGRTPPQLRKERGVAAETRRTFRRGAKRCVAHGCRTARSPLDSLRSCWSRPAAARSMSSERDRNHRRAPLGRRRAPATYAVSEASSRSTARRRSSTSPREHAPSLRELVLVASEEHRVEVYRREERGWHYMELTTGTLELASLGVSIDVDALYRDPTAV